MKKNILYVSELNLPNNSAYSIHVMKMCEAFAKLKHDVKLFTVNSENTKKNIDHYNIKYHFKIFSVFNKRRELNFFYRLIFSIKILLNSNLDNSTYISRSIIFALIASLIKKNIILELHHEITGLSKLIFYLLKSCKLISNLKFIFIHQNLTNLYKIDSKKSIVLDDAVCLEDFEFRKIKPLRKTCVYVGSFYDGKGIDFIFKLAKLNLNVNFHLFGNNLEYSNKSKNVKIFGFQKYKNIPKILSKYEVALMPYLKKVKGKSSIQLENYMSPLKMFDYLASKKIIIASNLNVYKHILKNDYNSKLVKVNDEEKWSHIIQKIFSNTKKFDYMKNNAYKTARRFTWDIRAEKILSKFQI